MINSKKKGMQSFAFIKPPVINSWATIVGPTEGEGPWAKYFDWVVADENFGEQDFEKAENKMLKEVIKLGVKKSALEIKDIELIISGDDVDKRIASDSAEKIELPYLGLEGDASLIGKSLLLGAMLIDGGFYNTLAIAGSSHHYNDNKRLWQSSEQSLNKHRTTHRTTTAAAAMILKYEGMGPKIESTTIGKVINYKTSDYNDLGSAIAPALTDTLKMHLHDLNLSTDYYDLILTGNLGVFGMALAKQLFTKEGLWPEPKLYDCSATLYDDKQGVEAGGFGAGCSGAILCGPILSKVNDQKIKKLLFIDTGVYIHPNDDFKIESIKAIAHAVAISI